MSFAARPLARPPRVHSGPPVPHLSGRAGHVASDEDDDEGRLDDGPNDDSDDDEFGFVVGACARSPRRAAAIGAAAREIDSA